MSIKSVNTYRKPIVAIAIVAITMGFSTACGKEPIAGSNTPSGIEALSKQTKDIVKGLEYSDKVGGDFAKMVISWKGAEERSVLFVWKKKLAEAKENYKRGKISKAQLATAEQNIAKELVQRISKEISINNEVFDLADVVKYKQAQCLGYSQVLYILADCIGLVVKPIDVPELVTGEFTVHTTCIIGQTDGRTIMLDLAQMPDPLISKPFELNKELKKVGNYWELKDKSNPLNIHRRIRILDRNGLIAGIYLTRGAAYAKQGKYAVALSNFNKGIELDPDDADAYSNRGNVYDESGQSTKAFSDYNKAIQLNPRRPEAYYNRGTSYRDLEQYERALFDFTEAIKLNPKFVEAYLNRGRVYEHLGQPNKAIADFSRAYELEPKPAKIEPIKLPAPKLQPIKLPKLQPIELPKLKLQPIKLPALKLQPIKLPKLEPIKLPAPKLEPIKLPTPKLEPIKLPAPKLEPIKLPAPKLKLEDIKLPAPKLKLEDIKVPAPKLQPIKLPAPKLKLEDIKVPAPKLQPIKLPAPKLQPIKLPKPEIEDIKLLRLNKLSEQIKQLVVGLKYKDKIAHGFIKMVSGWKDKQGRPVLVVWKQRLDQSRQEYKQGKISKAQLAKVEESVAKQLSQRIRKEISYNEKFFDLADVIKHRQAHCCGYTQLAYILGNSIGLSVKATNVVELMTGVLTPGAGHVACIVSLADAKTMMVDSVPGGFVSKLFIVEQEFAKVGNYWELRNKDNPLRIHRRIQILDRNGLLAGMYHLRGITYGKLGQHAKAISCFDRALELNPKFAGAYCNLGVAYTNLGQLAKAIPNYNKAIPNYNKAIELNPKDAEAYYSRGNAYYELGQLTKAISDYNKAVELNPKFAEAYNNRGMAYSDLGQPTKAISDHTKAIELNPKDAEAYYSRGNAYYELGQLTKAISEYTKAIKLDPKHAKAYHNRGVLYGELGQLTKAISEYTKAIKLDPKYAKAYDSRGGTRALLGNFEKARKDLLKAVELDPSLKTHVKKVSEHFKLNLQLD